MTCNDGYGMSVCIDQEEEAEEEVMRGWVRVWELPPPEEEEEEV